MVTVVNSRQGVSTWYTGLLQTPNDGAEAGELIPDGAGRRRGLQRMRRRARHHRRPQRPPTRRQVRRRLGAQTGDEAQWVDKVRGEATQHAEVQDRLSGKGPFTPSKGTVHTGGGTVHTKGGTVHTEGGTVHTGGGIVHTEQRDLSHRTKGPFTPSKGPVTLSIHAEQRRK